MSGDDTLSKEHANRIADAVESIDDSVSALQNHQHLSRNEYESDENRSVRRATEREFGTLVEASLDIAKVILEYETGQIPARRKATIRS